MTQRPTTLRSSPPGIYNVSDGTNPSNRPDGGMVSSEAKQMVENIRNACLRSRQLAANGCPQCRDDRRASSAIGRFIGDAVCQLCGKRNL